MNWRRDASGKEHLLDIAKTKDSNNQQRNHPSQEKHPVSDSLDQKTLEDLIKTPAIDILLTLPAVWDQGSLQMHMSGVIVCESTQLKSSDMATTIKRLLAYSPVLYGDAKIG